MITAIFHLYYEARYQSVVLGAFILWIIVAAVAFILWYSVSRDAHQIQPLVPALQSWWMKIHVPANFIGYGTFALAAMVAIAYILKSKNILANRLPSLELMDDLMYKAIAVGFAFFTIATILGALWAAEAWGGYWSWDPKETWALIVWLNYAAWLHMRLMKGLRGVVRSVRLGGGEMSSQQHKLRQERERKTIAAMADKIDMHDLLHSIFWNKPTRDEMKAVWERLNQQLAAQKIDKMQAEIDEAIEMGMGSKFREDT